MQALRFHDRRDIRLEDVPLPEPARGEARVRVTNAGLSQTQISEFMEGPYLISQERHPLTGFSGPIIPCQEFGGEIDAVGAGVDQALVGTQVAVLPLLSCGRCRNCQQGRPNICDTLAYRGVVGADGGFAEYAVADLESLFPVTDHELLNFIEPILIGIHAIKRLRRFPSDPVVVFGAGAVGCALAAVWQDCAGADVVVHDLLPGRMERARSMGLRTVDDVPAGSFEVAVDAAGKDVMHNSAALVDAIGASRTGGTVISIGSYFSPLSITATDLVFAERDMITSFAYDHSDVSDLEVWIDKLTCDFSALTTEVRLDRLVEDGYYQAEIDKDAFTRIVVNGHA